MKTNSWCFFYLIATLLITNTACDGNDSPSEYSQEGCINDTSIVSSNKSPLSTSIFIETSGSMFGFMPSKGKSSTEFQDDMWALTSLLSQKYPKDFSILQLKAKKESLVPLGLETFRDHMNSGQFQLQTSTDIPEMLDSVLKRTGASKVSVLISDLIFSPEDGAKARLDQIDTDIANRFRGKGLASSIFHFTSTYKGKVINAEKSPYYIWVIGPEAGVKSVNETIRESFPKLNELSYGINYSTPDYSILPAYPAVSNAIAQECTKTNRYYSWTEFDATQSSQIEFTVAANLSHLPFYAMDHNYLKNNLKDEDGNAEIISVEPVKTLRDKTDKKLTKDLNATHLIRVRVKNIIDDKVLKINLVSQEPLWYQGINADYDDKTRRLTFGLSKMISGLNGAYEKKEYLIAEPLKILITTKS